jgi:hypothetical protein
MDKENGETADRGEKSGSAAGAPSDAASLLDAASLFGEHSGQTASCLYVGQIDWLLDYLTTLFQEP